MSERRACRITGFARASHRYQSVKDDRAERRIRLRDLASTRRHYGYRRLHILLQLYREEGVAMRRKKQRRNRRVQTRLDRVQPTRIGERWSMDLMSDQLFSGQRFRLLTLVDNFSRVSLAIRAGQRMRGDDLVQILQQVASQRGTPEVIQVDNGPEFISKSLDWWAYFNEVKLDFSRTGKPTDNVVIELFNGRVRQACLNEHWFQSLENAQEKLDH